MSFTDNYWFIDPIMPLFWVSLAFLGGILLSGKLTIPTAGWYILAGAALIIIFPPVFRKITDKVHVRGRGFAENLRISSPTLYPLMVLTFCLGVIRFQMNQPKITPGFIGYYNDQASVVTVVGIVVEPADIREAYTNLKMQAEGIQTAGQTQLIPVHGMLLARLPYHITYQYGERIQLTGKLQTPPETQDFSYRDYLANQGIYSYLSYPITLLLQPGQGNPIMAQLYTFRERALKEIYTLFTDPEASLLAGILLGSDTGISAKLQEAFRLTGTSHIIVISGFNITIVAGFFTFLFRRFLGRYKGAIFAAVGIIAYTLLVGANAAVVRAAILGLLGLLGHLIGRRQAGLNSLTFAAGVMAVKTPTVLWDVSFQLSFAATLGIMLYAEPLTEWFVRIASRFITPEKAGRLARPVSEYFMLTLAAQLTTLPLMVYYFKRLSLTALVANPLILPAQPALMVLGGLAVFLGLLIHPLGQLTAWLAWPFTTFTIRIVEWLSKIPHGSIALGQVTVPTVLMFYSVLFTLTFARTSIKKIPIRRIPAITLSLLGIATVLAWRAAWYAPDGRLHITILDVGTGEGTLVQTSTGRSLLINGGASTNRLSDALGRRLPIFNRGLDWLVVADIDNKDLTGVTGNLERFMPANVWWAGNTGGTRASADLWRQVNGLAIPITIMQAGQALDLGDGATLSAITIGEKGAVLLLEWKNFRMLFPMGLDEDGLESLQTNTAMRNISGLMLAESGYAPVNPPEWITNLNPQVVVISVTSADRTGLPSPETLQAVEGYNLLRTDQNGWIEISTDGSEMWVEVEKK